LPTKKNLEAYKKKRTWNAQYETFTTKKRKENKEERKLENRLLGAKQSQAQCKIREKLRYTLYFLEHQTPPST